MIFGIDFDGTIVTHEYPNVGKEIGAAPVLKLLTDFGHKIICYTMRGPGTKEEQDAKDWFKKHDIPLYGFNENPDQASWSGSRKVYAHMYIDDAALGCPLIYPKHGRPFVDWVSVLSSLHRMGIIVGWFDMYCPENIDKYRPYLHIYEDIQKIQSNLLD